MVNFAIFTCFLYFKTKQFSGGNRALTVAASNKEEKDLWKDDLQKAIQQARDKTDTKITYLSLKSCSSSDEIMDQCGTEASTQTKPSSQRSNTTVHVCWHRNTSICMKNQLVAVEVSIYFPLSRYETDFFLCFRTNYPVICCANLKAATVGRNYGWSSRLSVCSSTKAARTIFRSLPFLYSGTP